MSPNGERRFWGGMECGSMVTVGRRMGGEVVARASDIDCKDMLEARVWAAEARLGSV
jgi:hypothetical protein